MKAEYQTEPLFFKLMIIGFILDLIYKLQNRNRMRQELNRQNLIACLSQKDKYKGTQAYIQEILRQNQQIYPIINEGLVQTMLSIKNSPMGHLLSLRFFKEIIITANFSLIDGIDQKIQEHLIDVAQYNKKSKQVNRGANYFSQFLKIKNDSQIQKISSSYVLLALEIIAVLSRWYLIDEDGEESRFSQYYKELSNEGVFFPQEFNFFRKDEEDKFKKNHRKWIQSLVKNQQPVKDDVKIEKKVGSLIKPPSQQPKNDNICNQTAKKVEEDKKDQVEQGIKVEVQARQLDICQTVQYQQLNQKLLQKTESIQILESKLSQLQSKCAILQSTIKNQQQQISKLSKIQQNSNTTLKKRQSLSLNPINQSFQIVINPPKINNSAKQILKLQQTIQNMKQDHHKEIESYKIQIESGKQQINKFTKQVQDRQKQIENLKNIIARNTFERQVKMNKVEASLVVIDEPKFNQKDQLEMIMIKQKILQSSRMIHIKDSNPKLRQKLSDISQNQIPSTLNKPREGSRSLKKTQSQHRLKMNQTSTVAAGFKKSIHNENKLSKTGQGFKAKEDGRMTTIFPYLQNYFPPLPSQCINFKQNCLSSTQPNLPFFQNQFIKAILVKNTYKQCYLQIFNKSGFEQKVKIMPTHPSISLEGQKAQKIGNNTIGQFIIKLGSPDLNMRCPMISVILGHHGISLTTSSNDKIFHLPLPITLLDFFDFKKSNQLYHISNKAKFSTNRFLLGQNLKLQNCLKSLNSQFKYGQSIKTGEIIWEDCFVRLNISEWSRQVSIGVEFSDNNSRNSSIGKVVLQILMYLLKD